MSDLLEQVSKSVQTTARVDVLTHEEGQTLFDEAAEHYLQISGAEFLRRWNAGEYDANPDRPGVVQVAMLRRFAE